MEQANEHDMGKQRDERMYEMWMAGKNSVEIAAAFNLTELRVIHEMNIILNNKAKVTTG